MRGWGFILSAVGEHRRGLSSHGIDLVTRLPKGAVLYKTFVHVVPAKPEGTFKLVAML